VKEIEVNAKTVEEAKKAALEQLGVTEDKVEVVVLKKGRSGVLGVGAEEAKIKVILLDQASGEDPAGKKNNVTSDATEILKTLLKFLGVEAEIHVSPESEGLPVTLNIDGDDLGVLIGRHGQALTSLQYVLRLILAERLKDWVPVNIDVAGYKKRRYESLQNLALRLAEQVKTSRRSINLEPMPADERRIIHMALSDHPDVATQSTGVGEERKIVISLRKR
jgi:spoIIIJ-associated protein